MALTVGSRLGHYDVTALIGEGGMGQVYQATDTKLNRQVALKILPEAFAADPDRLARFQREAQVLASLNHPGIAAIYGIEEQDDTRALVLELVEGPTLADRISKGPIPLDEALPMAKQIAEALEAAHEAGVIHRDLKPANIKVREDGTVKVLDFGLAKALDTTFESDPSQSPTMTAAGTAAGAILGTAAYMAPEQAKGRAVDRRADVWAFAAVVYEMVTGRPAFAGDNMSDVLANVIKSEPEWGALPVNLSPVLEGFLHRCLSKEPKQRVHDVADVRLALEGAFETTRGVPSELVTGAQLHFWQRPSWLAVLAGGLVGLTGLTAWFVMRPDAPRLVRFTVSPEQAVPLHIALVSPDIAISPNGRHIAYLTESVGAGADQLHVRPLDQLTSETLVSGGEFNSPFFSPDGESVGFYDRSTAPHVLKRVSVYGGPPSTICELPGSLQGANWGADGTIVFASDDLTSGLWRVAATGGEPEQLTSPDHDHGEVDHLWPQILPGGDAVLFTVAAPAVDDSQIAVLSLDSGQQTVLVQGGSYPRYAPTGHLLYGAAENLWAVAFDPNRLETSGPSIPVQEGVLTKPQGAANFSLSHNGTLAYVPARSSAAGSALVWVDRQGQVERLAAERRQYGGLRLSPDGRRAVLTVSEADNTDLVIYDLERDISTRLTFELASDDFPVWTPDGERVVFTSTRGGGPTNLFSRAADGTGVAARLTTSGNPQYPSTVSSDGRTMLIAERNPETGTDIAMLSMDAEYVSVPLIQTPFSEYYSELSPDGRWVAYQGSESGQLEIYVRPFPNVDDGRWQISRDGGQTPLWGLDGRELFFRQRTQMMVARIESEPTFSSSNPEILFEAARFLPTTSGPRAVDISVDGRFLMLLESAATDIIVVENWIEELKRLVPID